METTRRAWSNQRVVGGTPAGLRPPSVPPATAAPPQRGAARNGTAISGRLRNIGQFGANGKDRVPLLAEERQWLGKP